MKLGTRTRYSARAVVDLALNYGDRSGLVPAKETSTRQQVSPKYLEHLSGFATLRQPSAWRLIRRAVGLRRLQ